MDRTYFNEMHDSFFFTESRKALTKKIIKVVIFDLGILFAYGLLTCWIPVGFEGDFISLAYILFSLALNALILFFIIRKKYQKYNAFINQFYEMDESRYRDLCSQVTHAEFKYKTFYLLDDYFYVPGSMFLIKYRDIKDAKTIYHSTNFVYDGAQYIVNTYAGEKLTIQIKQFVLFKSEHDNFVHQLNEKINISLQKADVK